MKTYDPGNIDVIFADILLDGFAPDTFVSQASNTEAFGTTVGVDGRMVRERRQDKSGTITVTLMQTSESNDVLSDLLAADRAAANGQGVGALRIVDREGTTVFQAAKAFIMNDPDAEFGASAGTRAWVFAYESMDPFHGSVSDD